MRPDPFDLQRFLDAQESAYPTALAEIRAGRKRTHWMWFVFPQIEGLGSSPTSQRFAIKSLDEARAYLDHPVLGPRLSGCAEALLGITGLDASDVFGYPDDLKLRSSLTLFELASPTESVFGKVLEKFFGGERDETTLRLVNMRQ